MEFHHFSKFVEGGGELEVLAVGKDVVHLRGVASETAYIEVRLEVEAGIVDIPEQDFGVPARTGIEVGAGVAQISGHADSAAYVEAVVFLRPGRE